MPSPRLVVTTLVAALVTGLAADGAIIAGTLGLALGLSLIPVRANAAL
jgi:adenine/guanine phosphoribosyltransferase-like PRPP-binding protein